MRKIFALTLLSVFLIENSYFLYFKLLQNNIRNEINIEIKKLSPKKNISIIVVSKRNEENINWIRKNKEFLYNGKLYDIIKIKKNTDNKIFYCINDSKENDLISIYMTNNKKKDNIFINLKKIFYNKFLIASFSNAKKQIVKKIIIDRYTETYISKILEILSPPPKIL
jgi:hypothetical protein